MNANRHPRNHLATHLAHHLAHRAQRGVAAVEFALVLFVLMVLVSGTVEIGKTIWYFNSLTKSTRDGARLLSMAPADELSGSVAAAKNLVVAAATAAGVPDVTVANVEVSCLNGGFSPVACVDGTPPINVKVAIIGYNVVLGSWIGVFSATGTTTTTDTALAPHTTMRYVALN
jgi:Flp pilus assembly protein TadG